MGFYQNFGKNAAGSDGISNLDPAVRQLEEAGDLIEILHISSGKMAVFPAWITDLSDSFTSNWSSENIFGRSDPIGIYQGTTRVISVSLSIPSFSVVEARENMHQVEHIIANLYPSYHVEGKSKDSTLTMVGSPMVKVKFGNLIKNANKRNNATSAKVSGLSGWISNINFTPDLESGMHHMSPGMGVNDQQLYNGEYEGSKKGNNASHTFLPKVINLSFTLNVVHEHALGWQGQSWLGTTDSFPYGTETLSGGQHASGGDEPTTRSKDRVQKGEIQRLFKGSSDL